MRPLGLTAYQQLRDQACDQLRDVRVVGAAAATDNACRLMRQEAPVTSGKQRRESEMKRIVVALGLVVRGMARFGLFGSGPRNLHAERHGAAKRIRRMAGLVARGAIVAVA